MSGVRNGRVTVQPPEGTVAFLIGMRVNRPWRLDQWLPVFVAMPKMIAELMKDRSLGLLGRPRTFVSGRTVMLLQYWEGFDALESYARSRDAAHLPAWRAFNRRIRDNGSVGIFHETYVLGPGRVESVYVNMPPFGLGGAFEAEPPARVGHTAAGRLGRPDGGAPVEPY